VITAFLHRLAEILLGGLLQLLQIIAEISGGEYSFPPPSPARRRSRAHDGVRDHLHLLVHLVVLATHEPLDEKTVFSGLVTAWRFATWPTRRSPDLVNPTTDGVMRLPSDW
jgi:hypothetical protein